MPAIILCNVDTCCACVLASNAFIFLGVLQRMILICDEECVMRRIGDACDDVYSVFAIVMMSSTCVRGTGVNVPKFLSAFFEMQERGGCLHIYVVAFDP